MDGDIVDDSALKQQLTDDNTAALFIEENTACRSKVRLLRSQASVRSLPAQSSHKSLLQHTQHQRASVRRYVNYEQSFYVCLRKRKVLGISL